LENHTQDAAYKDHPKRQAAKRYATESKHLAFPFQNISSRIRDKDRRPDNSKGELAPQWLQEALSPNLLTSLGTNPDNQIPEAPHTLGYATFF